MSVTLLSLEELVQHCINENNKHIHRQPTDDSYWFELLRRALVLHNPKALDHIQRLFERRLTGWVYKHEAFEQTGESAEYFSSKAFSAFCVAMSKGKLAQFNTFAALMAYLKKCVHSAIMQYMRTQRDGTTQSLDSIAEQAHTPDLSEGAIEHELLEYIFRLFPDPQDQLLVVYRFVHRLPPRTIMNMPGVLWSDVRDITVQLYRIRNILRNDLELRKWIDL